MADVEDTDILALRVGLLPGFYDPDRTSDFLNVLLTYPGLEFVKIDNNSAPKLPKDPTAAREAIQDFYWSLLRFPKAPSASLYLHARHRQWMTLDHLALPGKPSSLAGDVVSLEMAEGLVAALDGVVDVTEATVSAGTDDMDRSRLFRRALVAEHGRGNAAPMTSRWGLDGVPYRLFVGPAFVELFGVDRLEALGQELAWPVGSGWMLAGAAEPEHWQVDSWCDQERAVIEALGREFFFDPATGTLPSVLPDLEASASVPVLLFDRDRGVYIRREPDGSVRDVGEQLPWAGPQLEPAPQVVVEGRRRAVTHMLSLMEEFGSGSDEDVYWVTEFLRSRPEVDRFDRWVFDFGCWVGELVRARATGGVWVDTGDGWRVVDEESSPEVVVDPFGEVRLLLETGEGVFASLKEFVADAVTRLAPLVSGG